jgi:hypothetical protein
VIAVTRIAHRRVAWRHDATPSAAPANGIAAAPKGVWITAITSVRIALA